MNPKPITRNLTVALTLLSLAGCKFLPKHPIDMGGPEAMPMEPMMDMDMDMPEIDIGM